MKAPIDYLALSNGARAGLTGFVAGVARRTVRHNVTINALLPGSFDTDRLAQTTIADVAVYGDVAYAGEGGIDLGPYSNIKAWMARVEKLPGFKTYEDALPKQDAA